MTKTDLVDSTALVTGASRGFGRTFQSDALHCRTTSKIYSFGWRALLGSGTAQALLRNPSTSDSSRAGLSPGWSA